MTNKMSTETMQQKDVKEEMKGFQIHRTVYLCVSTLLAIINLSVTPEFLWFLFPLTGMGLGLSLHYYLAIKRGY